jgi:hypothetical protein
LFELLSVSLAGLSSAAYDTLLSEKTDFLSEYSGLLNNVNFINAISKDSLKYNSVQERHRQFAALLRKYSR